MDAAAHRVPLLATAALLYAAVASAFAVLERPGLGIGHFFYLPIVLVAVAAGPRLGAAAGALAAALYNVGVLLNPHVSSHLELAQTAIRLTTFLAVGVVVGAYAHGNQALLDELSRLASRDRLTGLPNTRAFEEAIERRLAGGPFALLVGDVDELRRLETRGREVGDDALRRLADRLLAARRGDEVARVGGDEFAVLTELPPDGCRSVAVSLESALAAPGCTITFGWAAYPADGDNALALYRVADERLYARKVARGYRRGLERLPG